MAKKKEPAVRTTGEAIEIALTGKHTFEASREPDTTYTLKIVGPAKSAADSITVVGMTYQQVGELMNQCAKATQQPRVGAVGQIKTAFGPPGGFR